MPKKKTYDEVVKIIEEKGCKLLSKEYINSKTKMEISCSCGKHTFFAHFNAFMNGKTLCDECMVADSGKKIWDIDMIREYAKSKGSKLLSTEYDNYHTKLSFGCKDCSKPYKTDLNTFIHKGKHTCNKCSRKRAVESRIYTYDEVKSIIEDLGSELLSEEYVNAITPLDVKCTDCGKPIKSTLAIINYRKTIRCTDCGHKVMAKKQAYTYEQVKNIIELDEAGCKLISTKYNNCKDEIEILCGCGKNTIKTTFNLFRANNKKYCPECGGLFEWDINKAKEYVKEISNCELLSDKYISLKTKMLFRCGCGNKFETNLTDFKYNNRRHCSECVPNHSNIEKFCRDYFKEHSIPYEAEKTFPDCRYPITNGVPRYDFYIEYNNRKILIEGNGIQHEKPIRFYNAITQEEAEEKFKQQQMNDKYKKQYALDNGYEFVEIWYYDIDKIPQILDTLLQNK